MTLTERKLNPEITAVPARTLTDPEMEQAAGGIVPRFDRECLHLKKSSTGETKTENGVVYFQLKCDSCGALFWATAAEVLAPATPD